MRTVPILLLVAAAAGAAETAAAPAPRATVAGHAAVDYADRIPADVRDQVRAQAVALGRPAQGSALARGLARLAERDPGRFALRISAGATGEWAREGGIASLAVGKGSDPSERARDFAERVAGIKGREPEVAALEFAARDLPSGGQLAVAYKQYAVEADLSIASVQHMGTFTDVLSAPRIIGNGGGNGGGVVQLGQPFPIELPNVAVRSLKTHVKVPAGIGPDDMPQPMAMRAVPSGRDPRVAIGALRDAVASLGERRPETRMVFVTLPLRTDDNRQRVWFNARVVAEASARGAAVLDLADIQAHDADGVLAEEAHGPVIAEAWVDPGQAVMNAAGEERAARAWWVLMAHLAGWSPDAEAGTPESAAKP